MNTQAESSPVLVSVLGIARFSDPTCGDGCDPLRIYHWKSGRVMHEIAIHAIRIPKQNPTRKKLTKGQSKQYSKFYRTSIPSTKYNCPQRKRNVVQGCGITITVEVVHRFNWINTDSDITCARSVRFTARR